MKLLKIFEEKEGTIIRLFVFALVLLIIFPFLQAFFVKSPSLANSIRTVFLLQKLNKIAVIVMLIFAFISFEKLRISKFDKKTIIFAFASVIFLALNFYTQSDYGMMLNEGVGIKDRVDFDANRFLAPEILSDIDIGVHRNIPLEAEDEALKREVFLDKIPEKAEISWLAVWQGEQPENCKIFMDVNGKEFDVTQQFMAAGPEKKTLMHLTIDNNVLINGRNELVLRKECNIKILMITQTTYTDLRSYKYKDGLWQPLQFDGFVWHVKTPNPVWFTILFKLGFIFRLLAIIFLLVAIFGFDFFKNAFSSAKTEFLFAAIFSLVIYGFANFVMRYWLVLSKLVTASVYALLKLSFLNPVTYVKDNLPFVGAKDFVAGIVETCSGVEGIAYFLLLYTALLIFNWRKINIKSALIMYIPGLIGTVIVNILRVFLIILVGIFYSKEFAVGAFHTNVGIFVFIIYFVIFWLVILKYIRK